MPKVEDEPQVHNDERAKLDVQDNAAKQGAEFAKNQAAEMKNLFEDLGRQPGLDPAALRETQQLMDKQLDSLQEYGDMLKDQDPRALEEQDNQALQELGDALNGDANLEDASRKLDEATEKARPAGEQGIDPSGTTEQQAQQFADQERYQSLEMASGVAETAQSVNNASDQLRQIQDQIAQGGSPEEANQRLQQIQDQLNESVVEEEARKKRISQEMTDGEIEL